jgi:hypothetical protein
MVQRDGRDDMPARRQRTVAGIAIIGLFIGMVTALAPTAYASQAPDRARRAGPVSSATPVATATVTGPVSPTSLEFAPQQPFTSSPARLLTFTNLTGAPVDLQYSQQPNERILELSGCSNGKVPAGKSCAISVVFHPSFGGPQTGTTTIVLLTGDNTIARVPVTWHILPIVFCRPGGPCDGDTPITLDLGSVLDGRTSPDAMVVLRNFWTGGTTISDVATTPGSSFTVAGTTCGGALPSGATCTVTVRYVPGLHVGPAGDNLTVKGPWGGPGAENLALSAVGVAAPILSVSPASLSFPTPQQSGTSSDPQTVTVTNVGSADMRLNAGIATGGLGNNYVVTDCGQASISPGKTCQVTVVYRPIGDAVTPRNASLAVYDPRYADSRLLVPITTGSVLPLGFDPSSLSFPATPVDRVSDPQTIMVRNFYTSTGVNVIGFRLTSPDFEVTEFTCTGPIASGARCQIVARAHPTKAGHLSGNIVISLFGAVYGTFATETIPLSGMGTANSIGRKRP